MPTSAIDHARRSTRALALVLLAALVVAPGGRTQDCDGLGVVKFPSSDLGVTISGGEQLQPVVAAGDDTYLAVWMDDRSDFGELDAGEGTRDLYARRLAADGSPLDAVPFRVAGGLGRKQSVRVAWNGSSWLVAWSQVAPTQFSQAQRLFGRRVAADGALLDAEPILIHDFQWYFAAPVQYALASDGVDWAVAAFVPVAPLPQVQGRLVRADGTVTTVPTPLYTDTTITGPFGLTFANGRYLLTIGNKGQFLTPALATLGGLFTLVDGGVPQVASDGSSYMIAYSKGASGWAQIMARTMSAGGVLGAPFPVTPSGIPNYAYEPAIAWNGTDYVITFTQTLAAPTDVAIARVTNSGNVLDFGGVAITSGVDARNPQIASLADDGSIVAWVADALIAPYVSDVRAARVDLSGNADPALPLGNGRRRQGNPDLASSDDGYLSVYVSEHDGTPNIVAEPLDSFGNPTGAPVVVASGANLDRPRAAWNGRHFLVVWEDPGDLGFPSFETDDRTLGRRIAADGTLLDAAPLEILLGGMGDVAAVGDTFLVAASQAVSTQIRRIFVARVDGTGAVLDAPSIEIGSNFALRPEVAAFDDRWIVAWQRHPSHDNPTSSVRYAVVLPDGQSLGQHVASGAGSRPSVAASDDVGLVLIGPALRALRVGKDGFALGTTFSLSGVTDDQVEPSAAWTGSEFFVAWEDGRNAEAFFDDRHDIYATRVLEDGTILDVGGCGVSVTPDHDQMPVVAGHDGDFLVAFAKHVPDPPVSNVRIAYRRGSEFTGLAGGIAGALGTPVLEGDGVLEPLGTLTLELDGANPGVQAFHVIGVSELNAPLRGGILIPAPDVLVPILVGASDGVTLSIPLPANVPAPLSLWIQSWVPDAAAVKNFAASNGLTTSTSGP